MQIQYGYSTDDERTRAITSGEKYDDPGCHGVTFANMVY